WKDNAEPRMKLKCIFLSSIYLFLSVLSNLSFLNIYLAVLLLAVILKLRDLSKVDYTFKGFLAEISANLFLPITPSVILLLTTLIIPIKKLIQANELYFGGTHGFWQDTVRSLVSASLYGNNYGLDNLNLIIEIIIIIFLIGGVAVMCIPFIQKKKIGDNNFILWFSLMMIAYLSIEVQHALLGTKYVIERAAIYFIYIYYIFIALFFEKLKELIKNIFIVKIINYLFFTIVVVVFIHSVKTVNFFQTYEWKYDSNTNKVMQEIDVLVNQRKDEVTIGADWEFEPSLNFYKIKYNLDNILPVNRQGPDGIFNYYYLARDNFYIINKYNLKVLKYFSDSQTALAIKTHVNH
ncbi:MAG: hypothetical protein NT091_02290, partial [Candidatus Falkowbacteria bacterium]|nr:hypothetical protein [Candidatus Falkowbacteria bacterium]